MERHPTLLHGKVLKMNYVIKNVQSPLRPPGIWKESVSEGTVIIRGDKGFSLSGQIGSSTSKIFHGDLFMKTLIGVFRVLKGISFQNLPFTAPSRMMSRQLPDSQGTPHTLSRLSRSLGSGLEETGVYSFTHFGRIFMTLKTFLEKGQPAA